MSWNLPHEQDGKTPATSSELLAEMHDRPLTMEECSALEHWLASSDEAKDDFINRSIDHANLVVTHIAAQMASPSYPANEHLESSPGRFHTLHRMIPRWSLLFWLFGGVRNRMRISGFCAAAVAFAAILLVTLSLTWRDDTGNSPETDPGSMDPHLHAVDALTAGKIVAGKETNWLPPTAVPLADQFPAGELAVRLRRNFNRLEEVDYQPKSLFDPKHRHPQWPGDTEGRTALALMLLSQATGRKAIYLGQIIRHMPDTMNARGYYGPIHQSGQVDEQQLSSHGWVLRALCEYYRWKHSPEALAMLRRIVKNLVLPTHGMYAAYPIDPVLRHRLGRWSGLLNRPVNGFSLSSDVGCVFIFMDGVVQAYTVDPTEELFEIVQELIDLFARTDLAAINAQTHASLTGMRAALTYYGMTGDCSILENVEKKFAIYKSQAMTEDYENYNWFGRPVATEACGVVDSFLVAMELWRLTGHPGYLEDAHHIYFNGMSATQRASGGFGGNMCAGAKGRFLNTKIDEAHWCCTMRGGEGLVRAAQFAYFTAPHAVFVPTYGNNRVRLRVGKAILKIRQSSKYPFDGGGRFEIVSSTAVDPVEMRFFRPSFAANFVVEVNGEPTEVRAVNGFTVLNFLPSPGDVIEVRFELSGGWAEPINVHTFAGLRTLRYGPLVLAATGDQRGRKIPNVPVVRHLGGGAFTAGGVVLTSIYQLVSPPPPEQGRLMQVLF